MSYATWKTLLLNFRPGLQLWDLKGLLEGKSSKRKDLQSLAAVNAHDKDINSVAISPNESLVCTTSQDRTAKVLHH